MRSATTLHRGKSEQQLALLPHEDEEAGKGKAMSSSREPLVAAVTHGSLPRGLYMRLAHMLYGEGSSDAALAHAGFLAVLMCNIVGVYWLMRSLKDSVFTTVVGIEYQPTAKMLSLGVVTVILLAYNKAVDLLSAKTTQRGSVAPVLFGAVFSCFAVAFGLLGACLSSTRIGLYGPSGEPLPASPYRLVGWALYFAIEAYGSLSVLRLVESAVHPI